MTRSAAATRPVLELFRRGVADGSLRADLAPEVLAGRFSGLIEVALEMTAGGRVSVAAAAAAVTALVLDGARARPG
jgi:TetR/AcrR family transcriptional regulator, mexCD-oprJ operon repressor